MLTKGDPKVKEIWNQGHVFVHSSMGHYTGHVSHTVGLAKEHGCEVIMSGVRQEVAAMFLDIIAAGMRRGRMLIPNVKDDRWTDMPCVFKGCEGRQLHKEYVFEADNYWGYEVSVMQMVIPDRTGKFPWEPGYDQKHMASQKLLYELP